MSGLISSKNIDSMINAFKFERSSLEGLESNHVSLIYESKEHGRESEIRISRYDVSANGVESGIGSFMVDDVLSFANLKYLGIKHVIEIDHIFVRKELRNKGLATGMIDTVKKEFPDDLIVMSACVLMKEYPEKPNQDEFYEILEDLRPFFHGNNCVDVNNAIGLYDTRVAYLSVHNLAGCILMSEVMKTYGK